MKNRNQLEDITPANVALVHQIFAAWLQDRAEQYDNESGVRAAFDELMDGALSGEPIASYRAGELDDILERLK